MSESTQTPRADLDSPLGAHLAAHGSLLLGVVHLPPLPGSPRFAGDLDAVIAYACRDAGALLAGGLDGYVVENFGDAPFHPSDTPPWVPAVMARVAAALPRQTAGGRRAVVGANVLRNDALAALAVAVAAGLDFIRVNVHIGAAVTDQGLIEGRAADTLRARRALAATRVAILADVLVKHARPLGGGQVDIAETAEETAYRGLADALIVTGTATGRATSLDDLRAVRAAVPDRPLLVGSGVTAATVGDTLSLADGAIVGTSLKIDGRTTAPVDVDRVRALVTAAGR